jgi:hypothetical protein
MIGDQRIDMTAGNGRWSIYLRTHSVGWLALIAFLLAIIAVFVPYALGGSSTGGVEGAWYRLLSEAKGGYSLSRVQLFVWFLPTAILYGALSFAQQGFVEIGTQLSLLLGLSGATTVLGTASSPAAAASSGERAAPDLRDVVSDWNSQGDVSRYQYLMLSIVGAIVMVAAFWRRLEMPTVPSQFLYLVAGSQGTYLATKAIKSSRSTARTEQPSPSTPKSEGGSPSSSIIVPADS